MKVYELLAIIILIAPTNGASFLKKRDQEKKVRYDNYSVFRIKYETSLQRQSLLELTNIKQSVSTTFLLLYFTQHFVTV